MTLHKAGLPSLRQQCAQEAEARDLGSGGYDFVRQPLDTCSLHSYRRETPTADFIYGQ